MPFCVIYNCLSENGFLFPKNRDKTDKWRDAIKKGCNLKTFNPLSSAVVCKKHFKDTDFSNKTKRLRLVNGAVPSIFSNVVKLRQENKRLQFTATLQNQTVLNSNNLVSDSDIPTDKYYQDNDDNKNKIKILAMQDNDCKLRPDSTHLLVASREISGNKKYSAALSQQRRISIVTPGNCIL